MTRYLKALLAVMLMVCIGCTAYAASNIYKDKYTTESSTGNWTMAGSITSAKAIQSQLSPVSIISATPATLTTTDSGKTYIIDGVTANTIVTLTLPPASSTTAVMEFTVVSGDGAGIVLRASDSAPGNLLQCWTAARTSPAINLQARSAINGTGTTLNARSGNGVWYITANTMATLTLEARTADQKYGSI